MGGSRPKARALLQQIRWLFLRRPSRSEAQQRFSGDAVRFDRRLTAGEDPQAALADLKETP